MNDKKVWPEYLAAILTFLLGFCVWVIFGARYHLMWSNAPNVFPLFKIPSLSLGDAIFLPLVNSHLVRLLRYQLSQRAFASRGRTITGFVIAAIIVSLAVNSFTHNLWIHDSVITVVDTSYGHLSVAGWWHYGFSVVEITAILLFLAD
jgi:hypothetical protein